MPVSIRILFLMLTLNVLISACRPTLISENVNPIFSGQLVYVLATDPGSIDPHQATQDTAAIIDRQLYDTLVYRDPDTKAIIPGLAISWTVSEDQLTYIFRLRNNVSFHDGTLFNAEALSLNLDRIAKINSHSREVDIFISEYYGGYTILDEYTLGIILLKPFAPFLDLLSSPFLGIASPTSFNKYSTERYQFHQSGTGPFILEDYIPGKHILMRRNTAYNWGPAFYSQPNSQPIIEIEFRFVPDVGQRFKAVTNSQNILVSDLLPEDAYSLAGNSSLKIVPIPIAGQPIQFLFNTSRFPTDSLAFRQALLYAANRSAVADSNLQRFFPIAWGPLTENSEFYDDSLVGAYASDLGKSQSLLLEAGFSDINDNKVIDLGGQDASIKIIVQSNSIYSEIARSLTEQWSVLGIKSSIVLIPTLNALRAYLESNDYHVVAFSVHGSDPSILNEFFVQGSSNNWSKYSDVNLSNLLGQGIDQINIESRKLIYDQVQQIVVNQALLLPVVDPVRIDAASVGLDVLKYDMQGIPLLYNVQLAGSNN